VLRSGVLAVFVDVVLFFETGLGCGVCAALQAERPSESTRITADLYILQR
jgi:hypothetical protein